jgi:hypothetical protein
MLIIDGSRVREAMGALGGILRKESLVRVFGLHRDISYGDIHIFLLLVHSVLRFGILFQQTSLAVVRYGRIFYITAADCAGVHHVSRSPALLGAICWKLEAMGFFFFLFVLQGIHVAGRRLLEDPNCYCYQYC